MTKSIKQQFFFSHPPEKVWEYLTKPELMELWLMKNDFQPVQGHAFQFRTGPMPNLDFDGNIYCTVLEIVPFTRLSYSWKTGPGDGKITLDTTVVWILQPSDKGTELFLEHSGFRENEYMDMFNALNGGWSGNLKKIEKHLNAETNVTTNA